MATPPESADPDWPGFYRDPAKAASYEERRTRSWWRRLSWRRELALARALVAETEAPSPWLDVACGPGRTLSALPAGSVASDLSFAMVELARERAGRGDVRLLAADATRLPFGAGTFEGVLSLRFLHHLTETTRRAVLGEMHRVSKRWVIVSFPSSRTIRAVTRRLRGKPLGPRRSIEEFGRELAAAGWTLRRAVTVVPLLAETTLVLAERTPR